MNGYKVFHSGAPEIRKQVDVVLVRPENSGNVGSICRAMANMGIKGALHLIDPQCELDNKSQALAKHARDRLATALRWPSLDALCAQLHKPDQPPPLFLASTARIGSSSRPHPLTVREATSRALGKMATGEAQRLVLVFGPEGDGLRNEEVDLCSWVVTIPSSEEYRSLNLAQAVLIFCYEINLLLTEEWSRFESVKPSQKEKLVLHFIRLAEVVGFILPGDPFKMRPRLEQILSHLPPHIPEAATLHGLLDQAIRSVKKGSPDFKGRFLRFLKDDARRSNGCESSEQ